MAYGVNTCHPENILKTLLCFTRVNDHQLVTALISIFLGYMWQMQHFWSPSTVTSSLKHQTAEGSFSISDTTSSYMISLHISFAFQSEKPKHKHLHITNNMFKGIF